MHLHRWLRTLLCSITTRRLAVGVLAVAHGCSPSSERDFVAKPDSVAPVTAASGAPNDSQLPAGEMGVAIRRGRELLVSTKDSLPQHVGNELNCTSCHLAAGTKAKGLSLVGVYARFPQYRARSGRVNLIQERVNDCFLRSMNGKPIDPLGRDMADLVSYMAFISRGVPQGEDLPEHALPPLTTAATDTARGRVVFAQSCARCHGADGQGVPPAPPVWGSRSFTIGAGLARTGIMGSFIRHNMPLDMPGTLTDQEAADVSRYIASFGRPDFAGKEKDWPRGDPPADAAYATSAAQNAARKRRN